LAGGEDQRGQVEHAEHLQNRTQDQERQGGVGIPGLDERDEE
jgi:hypothetical protein